MAEPGPFEMCESCLMKVMYMDTYECGTALQLGVVKSGHLLRTADTCLTTTEGLELVMKGLDYLDLVEGFNFMQDCLFYEGSRLA